MANHSNAPLGRPGLRGRHYRTDSPLGQAMQARGYLSVAQFSAAAGMSERTVTNHLSRKSYIPVVKLAIYAEVLGIGDPQLLQHKTLLKYEGRWKG